MVCGGMFLSYGVFNIFIGYQTWTIGISTPAMFFIAGCFHIALIFGAIPIAFIYQLVDVNKIHVSFGGENVCQIVIDANILDGELDFDGNRINHFNYFAEFVCRSCNIENYFWTWFRGILHNFHYLRLGNFIS